jgi:uncharacterized protein with PQ loop repeat
MYSTIGHLFLNIAFVLYLILYLPQLIYNARHKKFEHMSFFMHIMLLQAYWCDLFYGMGRHMPWQYVFVSMIGVMYLLIQHGQWFFFNLKHHPEKNLALVVTGIISFLSPMLLYVFFMHQSWQIHLQAWVSRLLFIIHFIPQIIKYHQQPKERDAISLWYLNLSLSLSVCDLISAYCLRWDMANQWGSLISLGLKAYLYAQILWSVRFKPKLSFLKILSAR